MNLAIVGSRNITHFDLKRFIPEGTTAIVSGGAKGIDSIAEAYAKKNNLELIVFKPEYDKYPGKIAPLKRNDKIVEACDMLLAIWDGESRGTLYTINKAKKMGKPVRVEIIKKKSVFENIFSKLPF